MGKNAAKIISKGEMKVNISDGAQEILERYWIENREKGKEWSVNIPGEEVAAGELIAADLAKRHHDALILTGKGWEEAKSCVRRHRLAECLLADVLAVKKDLVREIGCEFEHVLRKDVEENICTLLGHPSRCPHGRKIPEGNCCRDNKLNPKKIVVPLTDLDGSKKGKVAYIKGDKDEVINKLTAMGILPGSDIQLLQKTPAFLIKLGNSQFAIDKRMAEHIHVRILG